MTDKMTRDDKLLLSYRRETLDRKLENIKNTLNGRNSSFLPFITNENGKARAEKLDAFVDELLAPLASTNKDRLTDLYRSFFYCALTGYADYDEKYDPAGFMAACLPQMLVERLSESFADIAALASACRNIGSIGKLRELEYEAGTGDLYPDEEYEQLGRFWLMADRMYFLITGKDITDTLSDDEAGAHEEAHEPDYELMDDGTEWLPETDDISEDGEDNTDGENDNSWLEDEADREAEEAVEDYRAAMGYDSVYSWEEWKKTVSDAAKESFERRYDHLPDRDKYVGMYLRFRELIFTSGVTAEEMNADIGELIDIFLYRHRLSAFSHGDDYGLITYNLDRVDKFMNRLVKKGGAGK